MMPHEKHEKKQIKPFDTQNLNNADKDLGRLIGDIRSIIVQARSLTRRNVNSLQVISNYLIGKKLVDCEPQGKNRAEYGKETLKKLSSQLTQEFGKGYSATNLEYMRKFYRTYSTFVRITPHTPPEISKEKKSQTVSEELSISQIKQTIALQLPLSWSHYLFLMGIQNIDERKFYEIESADENWSLRELKRQFNSSLYERLALSKDKKGVKNLSREGQMIENHTDVIKDPIVLEFLGFEEHHRYSETELEKAIIDKLENFLLELGKGFLFEARQKRFTFDEEHFYVDLVFYNRLLRCYVIIDLKNGKLKHQDLGQMQMYVNYFDRYVKLEDENPTVGILLCHSKDDRLVELTLPKNTNIHASAYQLYLPNKADLKKQLKEAQEEWEARYEDTSAIQDK